MAKTLILLVSMPIVANADIHIDTKPLAQMIAQQTGAPDIDTAQLRAAVEVITATAEANSVNADEAEKAKLAKLMANIDTLTKQAEQMN